MNCMLLAAASRWYFKSSFRGCANRLVANVATDDKEAA